MKTNISLKHINKLAIPALISGISEPILSLTDAAIVGNVELNPTETLAAVGIVSTFMSMLIWVFGQTRSAISSIVSQYVGANNTEAIKNLPAQAILIITALSFIIVLVSYPLTESIFKLYDATGLILQYCVDYYKIRAFGFPFTLFIIAVFGTFRGLQNTYYPMLIAIIGAALNIILDFSFVYGVANVIPAMHIRGAAYASVIAQLVMALFSAYFLLKKTTIPLRISFPLNKEINRFLIMIGNLIVRTLALNAALYFATKFATGYGKEYIAAYTIGINLWFLGAFIIDGYASAGNILSGKLLGAKDYKTLMALSHRLTKYGIYIGVIIAAIGGVLYYPIGRIFTKDLLVLHEFYNVFWIVLAMQPLCALAFIFDGMFKGMGKMEVLRNLLLLTTILVFIPTLYFLDHFDLKLYAIFLAFALWIIARGFPLIIIFRKEFLPRSQKT